MKKAILSNGVKLVYERSNSQLSSFCIGLDAGALMEENDFIYGTAHALEHMLFKGTKSRSENEINLISDEVFGFSNAMTNYPYTIYYGTTLPENLEAGINLYSDLIMNPDFNFNGFNEEMNIIEEELREWIDDSVLFCEDALFRNAFKKRRIKERIIGSFESIRALQPKDLENFYKKFYNPQNCVVSIVTSQSFDESLNLMEKYIGQWRTSYIGNKPVYCYEENAKGVFIKENCGFEGVKMEYCFSAHNLNREEEKALSLLNFYLGQSVTSILYDEIRTKHGMVYDISSRYRKENGLKILTINLSTSKNNWIKTMKLINNIINDMINGKKYNLDGVKIKKISDMIKIRRRLLFEKSVNLAKELCTYEIMFNAANEVYSEFDGIEKLDPDFVMRTAAKILPNCSVQILK